MDLRSLPFEMLWRREVVVGGEYNELICFATSVRDCGTFATRSVGSIFARCLHPKGGSTVALLVSTK